MTEHTITQAEAVLVHLTVLVDLGVRDVILARCPECSTPLAAPAEHGRTLCPVCGAGPVDLSKTS